MGQGRRLAGQVLEQIENRVRLWSVEFKNVAAQLILHIRWQKSEISRLEKELTALQKQDLFVPPKKNTWTPDPHPELRGTLEERIVHAFENSYQDRPSFLSSLTRHGKSLVEAEIIYLDWKKKKTV